MKFQVQGELDIPVEITELLTGMCIRANANNFDDITMSLNQKSLDRLSIILNLIYATQPIKEVEKSMLKVVASVNVEQPRQHVIETPVSSTPTQKETSTIVAELRNAAQKRQNVIDVTALGLNEQKVNKDTPVKSIAALSKNMKGRVG